MDPIRPSLLADGRHGQLHHAFGRGGQMHVVLAEVLRSANIFKFHDIVYMAMGQN